MRKMRYIIYMLLLWVQYIAVRKNKRFQEDLYQWVIWKSCPYKERYRQFVCLIRSFAI